MKFGQRIERQRELDPQWSSCYLDYRRLKTLLEELAAMDDANADQGSVASSAMGAFGLSPFSIDPKSEEFLHILLCEVERITLFVFDQTGRIAVSVARCRYNLDRIHTIDEESQRDTHENAQDSNPLSMERDAEMTQSLENSGRSTFDTEILVPIVSSKNEEPLDELLQYKDVQANYFEEARALIRLYKFVEINVTGIRKILKKHDKLISGHRLSKRLLGEVPLIRHSSILPGLPRQSDILPVMDASNALVKPLLNDDSLGALVVSIETGLHMVHQHLSRLGYTPQANNTLGGSRLKSTSYQSLSHLQSQKRIASSHSSGALDSVVSVNEDVDYLLLQLHAARRGLRQTNDVIKLLAAPLVLGPPSDDGMEEEQEFTVRQHHRETNRLSNLLNLLSTFFYMTNYYIVAPSSGEYAKRLGGNAALASLIIGMTPLAALVSTVLYSWWTSYSYKHALLFASTCSVIGNLLYALGLPFNSLPLVMIGRLLNGFGSARSINRRYIADTFPFEERTAASATFVTAGALGMAAGPAIASFLHWLATHTATPDNLYWQVENAPGVFMLVVWISFLTCMVCYFEDPPKKKVQSFGTSAALEGGAPELQETQPLLPNSSPPSLRSDPPIWKNVPVIMTLSIYFVLKLNLEAVLSAAANVSEMYFGWDPSTVGLFLAGLGLLMLPANVLVAYLSRTHEDRDLILGLLAMMSLGCFAIVQYFEVYTEIQYILASVVLFVSSTALEGPNMSLLSKTIPQSWRKGVFNVGFLATESGTLGRTVADFLLAIFGRGGLDSLLNRTFGSFSVVSLATLGLSFVFFDYLQPQEGDD